jgi:hypothetical protein
MQTYCFTIQIVGTGVDMESAWDDALEANKIDMGNVILMEDANPELLEEYYEEEIEEDVELE